MTLVFGPPFLTVLFFLVDALYLRCVISLKRRRRRSSALWAVQSRRRAISAARRLELAVCSSSPRLDAPVSLVAVPAAVEDEEDAFTDWPISDSLRDFAFASVVFRALSVDIEPLDIAL
jgi:hypothetical protein